MPKAEPIGSRILAKGNKARRRTNSVRMHKHHNNTFHGGLLASYGLGGYEHECQRSFIQKLEACQTSLEKGQIQECLAVVDAHGAKARG